MEPDLYIAIGIVAGMLFTFFINRIKEKNNRRLQRIEERIDEWYDNFYNLQNQVKVLSKKRKQKK